MTFADLTAEESLAEALAQLRASSATSTTSSGASATCSATATGRSSRARSRRSRSGRTAGSPASRDGPRHQRAGAPRARAARVEERYRFLVENSPDVVFATDADGHFTFMSEAIGADDRLRRRTSSSASTSRRSSTPRVDGRSPATAGQTLVADPATEQVAELDPHRHGRAARPRSRSAPRHASTTTGGSPASTARPATSASASASSASCASPRSATATSSRRRRTSSG